MKRYEYETRYVAFDSLGKMCEQMGEYGWELVTILPYSDNFVMMFKREKEEGE